LTLIEAARRFLGTRRYAYQQLFRGVYSDAVLTDLAKFCHARESTLYDETHDQKTLEGRRQVWLRVTHHLNLSEKELWRLYDGREDVS